MPLRADSCLSLLAAGLTLLLSSGARAERVVPPPGEVPPASPAATSASVPAPGLPRNVAIADLGQHVIGAGYQRSLSPSISAQIVGAFYDPWTQNINFLGLSGDENKGGDLIGAIVRARAFFYPSAAAPTGLWVSPFAQAGLGWGKRDGERKSGPVGAGGLSVGYSALFGDSVLFGLGGGVQFHAAKIPGGSTPPSFARFYPHLDIQLGYAF
jgi:hypothetical protein